MNAGGELRTCAHCKRPGMISKSLKVCKHCIIDSYSEVEGFIANAHSKARARFGLPATPPAKGAACVQCVNMCKVPPRKDGYCGVRRAKRGSVESLKKGALVQYYYDPLPTNCVADFVCPAGTGCGYPRYSKSNGAEHGYKNLAVFYGACNFHCLFCQNWQFRNMTKAKAPVMTAEDLASKVDDETTCICYFGGDPTPQIEHALETSRLAIEHGDLLRICFETNGSMNRKYVDEMSSLSYSSGGCIKIDLKARDQSLNKALCGTDNRWTLNNFRRLAEFGMSEKDRGVPFLVASTLLVPGYVEEDEVRDLASFIASLNPEIPYSLLAFSPHYCMTDLPLTSNKTARKCLMAAREAGVKRVRLGNVHLVR